LTKEGKRPAPVLAQKFKGEKILPGELILRAKQAFDNYLRLQGEGRFVEAAKELSQLRETLQQLAKQLE
jgi:hypothetical protein